MGGSGFESRPTPPVGPQAPSLLAMGSCFPYGGVKRIRFEDSRSGSCPILSPAPRTRLNKLTFNRQPARGFIKSNRARSGPRGCKRETRNGRSIPLGQSPSSSNGGGIPDSRRRPKHFYPMSVAQIQTALSQASVGRHAAPAGVAETRPAHRLGGAETGARVLSRGNRSGRQGAPRGFQERRPFSRSGGTLSHALRVGDAPGRGAEGK